MHAQMVVVSWLAAVEAAHHRRYYAGLTHAHVLESADRAAVSLKCQPDEC
jgi:hypothetical protein